MSAPWRWGIFLTRLDPVVGSEQAGTRPVLAISSEDFNETMAVVTVLPITSRKKGRKLYSGEALLHKGIAGLSADSIVLAHQIRTVSKKRFLKRIGFLETPLVRLQVLSALESHLDID
ncbi:MAG: type II toxin-antitoxin system PemK/MazF family toxin [Dehalococcoidia bacterium]|nr:type II toxin-antitoxin system PemK/MazF family toxin [Dehalococcoidia bacterium]